MEIFAYCKKSESSIIYYGKEVAEAETFLLICFQMKFHIPSLAIP